MKGMHWLRLGFCLVVLLTLAACERSDFPGWLFLHPPRVSSEAGSNNSDMPDIYSDSGNNVAVAWSSDPTGNPGGSDTEVYWRRYSSLGVPQTPPVRLTNNSFGDYYPSVGMSGGITYLVWMGDEISSSNIYWAAVDQGGNFVAGPQLISDPDFNDYDPHLIQCGNYSHVYWTGDSELYDNEIYYSKIRYNGIIDIPYKRVTNSSTADRAPVGEVDQSCSQLFIAYEFQYQPSDINVLLVGINTADGSDVFGKAVLGHDVLNETDIDIAVSPSTGGDSLISVVWNLDDGAGREIYYGSRYSDGSVCELAVALTDDSQIDWYPVVDTVESSGNIYPMVFWERVQPGTGLDLDIYAASFQDNCNPSPPSPSLISELAGSAESDDAYPQVLVRLTGGVPTFNVIWRTLNDGAVWSRFGTIFGPVGPSELISDDSSAGIPSAAERVAPVVSSGNQIYVTWVGDNLGTGETWYQQTAWRISLPVVVK